MSDRSTPTAPPAPSGSESAPTAAATPNDSPSRRLAPIPLAIGVLAAVALLAAGLLLRPRTPTLRDAKGDPDLICEVERFTSTGDRLSVVVVDPKHPTAAVRAAHWGGADDRTPYEIGSLTKGITGLLVAQAVERGELRLDEPIGQILPLEGAPVAATPLRDILTHRSGLPTVPPTAAFAVGPTKGRLTFSSPYLQTEAQVLDAVRRQPLGSREYRYSNLGAALAGQAAAKRAGIPYPELVRTRVTGPLGLHHTEVQGSKPLVAPGLDGASGRPTAPWGMDYMAPAGAIVSTPADLTLFAKALAEGRVPGQRAAMAPLAQAGNGQIGYFWITSPWSFASRSDAPKAPTTTAAVGKLPGRVMAWHNGGSGGYTTMFCLDPETGRTVIVLHGLGHAEEGQTATRLGAHLLRVTGG